MKTESVAEFLARGGKINKIAPVQPEVKESIKINTPVGAASFITMDEADLYGSPPKVSKAKKKSTIKPIDVSALPEALRKKYVDEVLNGAKENDSEEDEE